MQILMNNILKENVIVLFDVLEHLCDPVSVFKIIHQKLRKNGYCMAFTPNIFSVGYELMGGKQNTLLPFEHLCFYNKESLSYFAEKINIYGWDYYMESSPDSMSYWQLYFNLNNQLKEDIIRSSYILETAIVNYYYGYHLFQVAKYQYSWIFRAIRTS